MNPASIPQIAIPRSKFLQDFDHAFSCLHGELIPIDCFEVIAGDDFAVHKAAQEIIMSTPIAPIMGNIKVKVTAMFVPMRLLWKHTEEFFGANKTSSGPQTTVYTIPNANLFYDGNAAANSVVGSVSHHLGKPIVTGDSSKYCPVSVLKERGYWLCASEWYRAQQLTNPVILDNGDGDASGIQAGIGTYNGSPLTWASTPWIVSKQIDLFTAATLFPQYGSAVELPLGTFAPLKDGGSMYNLGANGFRLGTSATGSSPSSFLGTGDGVNTGATTVVATGTTSSAGTPLTFTNLVADLSQATAAKINDIRYAFQLQKYLERANFGSRFFEVLAVHYGVTSPDSRLQRPEYLGGKSAPISIRTVLSQAGYVAGTSTEVGQMGAVSQTFIDLSGLFSKGFVEPGYVYILMSTNHERLYSQGLLREDTKFDRFEFYSPEFNNLGDQAIRKKELMVTGNYSADNAVFGYQGHWDEYRFRRNLATGKLDPATAGSLGFWTLGEVFASQPSLSDTFIRENRDALSRCLVTGATGPDYISDVYIQYAATREMSMYAIPGLIDHFGAL